MSRIVGPSDTTNDTFYPSLNSSYLSTPKRWSLSQHQRMIYVQQNVLKRQKNRTRNITRIQEDSFLYYLLWIIFSLKSQDLKIIHPANFSPLCSRTHYTQEKRSERSLIWLPLYPGPGQCICGLGTWKCSREFPLMGKETQGPQASTPQPQSVLHCQNDDDFLFEYHFISNPFFPAIIHAPEG